MSHKKKNGLPFPSKAEVLAFIQKSPEWVGEREIARAFRLKGGRRAELKRTLRELQDEGQVNRGRSKRSARAGALPGVSMITVTGTDADGQVLARPAVWNSEDGALPLIRVAPQRRGQPALGEGDRALAHLKRLDGHTYEGRVIRVTGSAPPRVLGILTEVRGDLRIEPTGRKHRSELLVTPNEAGDAQPGDLVRAELLPGKRLGLRRAKITERIGRPEGPGAISMIATHNHDIPAVFSNEALGEAEAMGPVPLGKRQDLRDLPLITIDSADARDFDDAVWAESDPDTAKNPGGWRVIVAIADVAFYVRPGMALDETAYERGNSVYFPDRCLPMLPEPLSTGWCSLKPGQERPVLAAHLWIDSKGALLRHTFTRALMRSAARLTYSQTQAAHDGMPDETSAPLAESVIAPLYGVYGALSKARLARGILELDVPEHQVTLDDAGKVARVEPRLRLESHKLIEELMITANVAAAQTLEGKKQHCMYRVHDAPAADKTEALAQLLASLGIKLAQGQVTAPAQFNRILKQVENGPFARMVNDAILRSQAQAVYSPKNIGHFGLALRRYCHFTSPIRRYSDLVVHRALIDGLGLGEDGLGKAPRDFAAMGEHISITERRAAAAERDAMNRFVIAFLAPQVGATFAGRINGVTRFGLFVTLIETGADGLIPIRSLPEDWYVHDEIHHCLTGERTGLQFRLGQDVDVRLAEANPTTGSLVVELLDADRAASSAPRSSWRPSHKKKPFRGRKRR